MNRSATAVTVFVAVFLMTSFFGASVFAKGFEQPPGEPPFGVAVQQDAAGTKLSGQIVMGLVNTFPPPSADVYTVLWLQKGSQLPEKFTAVTSVTNVLDPAIVQQAITNVLAPQILQRYFPGQQGLTVTLKSLTGFQDVFLPVCIINTSVSCFVNLADITVAIQ